MRTFIAAQRGIALLAAVIVLMLSLGGMSVAQSVANDVRVINSSRDPVPVTVHQPYGEGIPAKQHGDWNVKVTDPVDVKVTAPVAVAHPDLHGAHLNYASTYSLASGAGYDFWFPSTYLSIPAGAASMTARHLSMLITTPASGCTVQYVQLVGHPPKHWTTVRTYHTATQVAPQRWVVDADLLMPRALGVRGMVQCPTIPSSTSKVNVEATVTGELVAG